MHYLIKKDGELYWQETEVFPEKLESLYQSIRGKYTVEYRSIDWSDDDSDAGRGYCYDNSYSYGREPYREEMIIENDELVGFYVGSSKREPNKDHILPLKQDVAVYSGHSSSSRYAFYQSWVLKIEETPAPAGYVFLTRVSHEDKNKVFSPADFSEELVEAVTYRCFIEDSRGHFNGASRLKLKLTPAAIQNPDHVLDFFQKYWPVMVRS